IRGRGISRVAPCVNWSKRRWPFRHHPQKIFPDGPGRYPPLVHSGRQGGQAFFEKAPRRALRRELDGARIGGTRLRVTAQPAAKVRTRGMSQLISLELAAGEQRVERRQARFRTI